MEVEKRYIVFIQELEVASERCGLQSSR
jgi:hypothetical protein